MDELLKFSERLNLYRIFQDEKRLQMTDISPKWKGININLHNCSEKRARGCRGEGEGERAERERCERFKLCVPMRRQSHGFSTPAFDSENSSEIPIFRRKWPSTLSVQLKKFVQRINNGRRTTVSKCRVYLATNKASTRRYPRPQEICLSLSFFLRLYLYLSLSLSLSFYLFALSFRQLHEWQQL